MSHRSSTMFVGGLLIAILSGAAALSHQLVWTRRLIDLLGASHASAARVFGCFFFGLALGAAVAGHLLPRIRHPWRWVAGAEFAVAVLSLPALTLPSWTSWLWPLVGIDMLVGWPGGVIKGLASAVVVLPPAMAMGTTLPWLGAALLKGERSLGREGVWIYAVNTAGGVIGLAVTVLVALQEMGGTGARLTLWQHRTQLPLESRQALKADLRAALKRLKIKLSGDDERVRWPGDLSWIDQ